MNSSKTQQHSDKLTIALLGEKPGLIKKIEDVILQGHGTFVKVTDYYELRENDSFRIISAPTFFDKECMNPNQKIIDLMALSDPGPHLFILAIESENASEDKVTDQISNLKKIAGKNVTNKHLAIILENSESHSSLKCAKEIQIKPLQNSLASELKDLSLKHQRFKFDYKHYSQDIVKERREDLESRRNELHPQNNPQTTAAGLALRLTTCWRLFKLATPWDVRSSLIGWSDTGCLPAWIFLAHSFALLGSVCSCTKAVQRRDLHSARHGYVKNEGTLQRNGEPTSD